MKKLKHIKLFEEFSIDIFGNLNIPDCIEANINDDENDAYDKGKESKIKEYSIEDNPYSDDELELKIAWNTGFNYIS